MKIWHEIIKPTLVLVIVCAVVSGALALTYNLTGVAELGSGYSSEQLIEFSAKALPEADKLTEVKISTEDEALLNVYKAENGAGMAIVLNSKGYSSDGITMMVGLNPDGVIQGVYIIEQTETPGIGDKVANNESDYLEKFVGNKKGEINADTVAGATKTSKGLIAGCEKATELFEQLKGEVLGA